MIGSTNGLVRRLQASESRSSTMTLSLGIAFSITLATFSPLAALESTLVSSSSGSDSHPVVNSRLIAVKLDSEERSLAVIAERFADNLGQNEFSQATVNFDSTMKGALPPAKLEFTWKTIISQYGRFKGRLVSRIERLGQHIIVLVPVEFANNKIDLKIVFSGNSKISGFFIVPHTEARTEAASVVPTTFTEQKLTVGTGQWKLDGSLTLPEGKGPFPALVLIHGSGPQDMDETIGPNKPFKDLACGLASRGVAVLRYEKRTRQYSSVMVSLKNLTVQEESIDDALEAVKVLQKNTHIARDRIFVLGHSLGGMLIPRIAAADNDICGFISLAGSNEPLEDAIVRQTEYLLSLGEQSSDEGKQKLAELKQGREQVKALKEAENGGTIFGAPSSYWLDLRKHDPLQEIKLVDRPVLFLQGGRDYQVTATGDFHRWKAAVQSVDPDLKRFKFQLYPSLNHLFMTGSGKCQPSEYLQQAGNVDKQVIADIADWIKVTK